jgi:hypothetical protein
MDGAPNREPGWAEMFVPILSIQPNQIQLDEPRKSNGPGVPFYAQERLIAQVSYKTDLFRLPVLSVLLPWMRVHSWDSTTGRLELELDPTNPVYSKLQQFQEAILTTLADHPTWLRMVGCTKDSLKVNFQPILSGKVVTIYLHGPNQDTKPVGRVWIWKDGWQKGAVASSFRKGQLVKTALRFQGLCFLQSPTQPTRLRIQHQTVAMYHQLSLR